MAALAMQPAVVDTFDLLTGGTDTPMRVEERRQRQGAPGLTARDLRHSGAVLLALRSSDGVLRVGPGDDERLAVDDILVAMGTASNSPGWRWRCGPPRHTPEDDRPGGRAPRMSVDQLLHLGQRRGPLRIVEGVPRRLSRSMSRSASAVSASMGWRAPEA